jgi:hypothetical protein
MYTIISAFTDDAAGYTKMPGWNSAEQMGGYVKKYLAPSDTFEGTETLAELLEVGLASLMSKVHEMLGSFMKDPAATWDEHALAQLNAVHQFVVAVLLGTNVLNYGEKTLQDFRWQQNQEGDGGKQIILRVGGEGGELTLAGIQNEGAWQFRVETDESASNDLLDDEGPIDEVLDRPWVATWRSALKQLDAYPWTQLYPLAVHLDFRDRVFKALQTRQKKGLGIDWDLWGTVLGIDINQE